MGDRNVSFLNALRVIRGYHYWNIDKIFRHSPALPQESDDSKSFFLRRSNCPVDILRFPARADRDEHIALVAESLHLARENVLESKIIPGGGQHRSVGRKRNCRQWRTVGFA